MSFSFRKHKTYLLYLFPVLVFGTAIILLLLKSDQPDLRFIGKYQKPLFLASQQVDLVFMGTSRMRRAIYTPFVDEVIDDRVKKLVVWDASFPGRGMGAEIVYLEELIKRHTVKKIYLHYFDASATGIPRIHPSFVKYAGIEDILFGPLPGVQVFTRLQIRLSMLAKKLDHTLIQLLDSYADIETQADIETNLSDRLYDNSIPRHIVEFRQKNNIKRLKSNWEYKARSWNINKGSNLRSTYFLKRFIKLAQEHGVEVVLIDLPKSHMGPLSKDHMEKVGREFGVEYISVYSSIDKATDYGDRGHLNIRGAYKIATIVSGQY